MGVRSCYRYDSLYMLSGVAIRLARKMGLHRDGSTLGLPFYETEMRRRLWWHLVHSDFRLSDTLSSRPSLDLCACDTEPPRNLEDTDFSPETATAPQERHKITSVAICRLRTEMISFFRSFLPAGSSDVRWEILSTVDLPMAKKDAMIRQLEDRMEENYLRYCDPSEPLHTLLQIMIRSGIAKMKLFAHNPRQYADRRSEVPQSERDIVFTNASKLLEYATLVPGTEAMAKYMWQISTTYLWNTMLYMLIEARHRKTGPEIDRMWRLISKLVEAYPQLFEGAGAIGLALRKWMLEVWDDYVMALRDARLPEPSVPDFISDMRRSMSTLAETMPKTDTGSVIVDLNATQQSIPFEGTGGSAISQENAALTGIEPLMNFDFSDILSFEMDPNEWSQWETLVQGNTGFA